MPGWVLDTCSDRVKHSSGVRFGYMAEKSVDVRNDEECLFLVQHSGRSGTRSCSVYVLIGVCLLSKV